MKELTEALERLVKANKNNTGESVMSAIENAEKTIQKAKQKEAIEQSTNWQMKEEDAKKFFEAIERDDPPKDELVSMFEQSKLSTEEKIKYPIGGYAPGHYWCKCVSCKEHFTGDKRAVQCEPCAIKSQQPELTAEEFLRSKMEKEDLKDYFANFYLGISGKRYYMKDLLTEFKNQNG